MRAELSVGGQEHLPASDELGTALPGRLDRAFEDGELGFTIASGVEPEEAFFQDIERGPRGVNFESLFLLDEADAQIDVAAQEMDPDTIVTAPGQVGKFYERIVIDPEIVLSAKAHLRPPILGFDLIALDDGQVDHARFRPEVAGPLDDDVSLDVGQPDKAPAVIILVLGESA